MSGRAIAGKRLVRSDTFGPVVESVAAATERNFVIRICGL